MAEEATRETGRDRLIKSLDARSSFFQFGYYLQALETLGLPTGANTAPDRASDAEKLLDRLSDTASRCSALEFLCPEIKDVSRLLDEKAGVAGKLPDDLLPFLGRCARRWFGRVRELPKKSNSLAVDIAFNLELAGCGELAADLYEAIICMENGAFRASRLMSRHALEKALIRAGAAGEDLEGRLGWAKKAGLVTASDMRSALANFRVAEGTEDEDASSAEWALDISLRLSKKLLRQRIEQGLLGASRPAAFQPARSADRAGSE